MIRSLHLTNFTVFPNARLECSDGLNVIVGENGTGKTHLLKVAYTLLSVSARGARDSGASQPTKDYLRRAVAQKLRGVFKPDELGRLARRQQGRQRAQIQLTHAESELSAAYAFATSSRAEVDVVEAPSAWSSRVPVYLPTRELLSIYPNFVSLYDTTHTQFDETWRDTCLLLGAPLSRGPKEARISALLGPLEEAMEGQLLLKDDRFYLKDAAGSFEMHLVAEGLRKLAMIARLIATGTLLDKGYLFWDEPEANLNPRLIRRLARTMVDLSRQGLQVFVATHSLFLLRELQLLQAETPLKSQSRGGFRYFGLHRTQEGVHVDQGDSIDDIGDITALDEDLKQSERYLDYDPG